MEQVLDVVRGLLNNLNVVIDGVPSLNDCSTCAVLILIWLDAKIPTIDGVQDSLGMLLLPG